MTLLCLDQVGMTIGGQSVLDGVSLEVGPGEILGLVGESGSGKSMTLSAITGLVPQHSALSGSIRFEGRELVGLDDDALCALRGASIGFVFQEPMTALNPVQRIGEQIGEMARQHRASEPDDPSGQVAAALERVGLSPAMAARYPHELSGGQRQRVLIAMATLLRPRLLLADEPTTALDSLTAAGILALLVAVARADGSGLVLVTHDLALAASVTDKLAIMQAGRIIETGATAELLAAPQADYSRTLLAAARFRLDQPPAATQLPLLEVTALRCGYQRRSLLGTIEAAMTVIEDVSLSVGGGETVGLVGPSGCGKSTLARAILGLEPISGGAITLAGQAQIVFQDPAGSFNPTMRVRTLVAEPLWRERGLGSAEKAQRVGAALEAVGLDATVLACYPHQLSGGQRQRVSLARALVARPSLIILDEALSALDVSVRARVLKLLARLQADSGIAYLFITHDLGLLTGFASRVAVMDGGRIVETGPPADLLASPRHPTTQALVAAARLTTPIQEGAVP